MSQAELFNFTMRALWDDDDDNLPMEARAIASYVKNHRVNAENALEVMSIMWPQARVTARAAKRTDPDANPDQNIFDVTFDDGSQCMIIAHKGIGSGVEAL